MTSHDRDSARRLFAQLLDSCTDPTTGVVNLRDLLHVSTREQDAAAELGWTEYEAELLQLTAAAQTLAERGEL